MAATPTLTTEHTSMQLTYRAIGTIHSPFTQVEGMPIQPSGATGVRGTLDVLPEYTPGLKDLSGFSHIILLYHFHRASAARLVVTPFLDSAPHGLFATRAPTRPNPIGLSVVRLLSVGGGTVQVEDVDVLDGTPLLDIKPYVPEFDGHPDACIGWLEAARGQARARRADARFR